MSRSVPLQEAFPTDCSLCLRSSTRALSDRLTVRSTTRRSSRSVSLALPSRLVTTLSRQSSACADYRHFQAKNITPRFGFGFGLSYTSFEFSNLKIEAITNSKRQNDEQEAYNRGVKTTGSSTADW